MAIFPVLVTESKLQQFDKTRLDGTKSFISTGEAAISLIEIQPEATASFVTVTSDMYLDWAYETDGSKVVTLRITTDGSPTTRTSTITVVTEANDKLFSKDSELVPHEPDIMNYVPEGRSSFINVHRLAQDRILTYLDEKRIADNDGNRLTASAIIDTEEVNDWSKFLSLQYIFEGLSSSTDDIFSEKAERYRQMVNKAKNRAVLRFDKDGDGVADTKADLYSMNLIRR